MKKYLAIIVGIILLSLLTSCHRKPETGPPFIVIIIDTSASTKNIQEYLSQYAKLALDDYSKKGKIKVTVINLNEKPSTELQKEGELYEEDIDAIINKIKIIQYKAKGTDIVGAIELAMKYHSYERKQPSSLKILCFTDGIIESARGITYKTWKDLDLSRLNDVNGSIGFYFIDPSQRDKVEVAVKNIKKAIVKNENDAIDDLKQENAVIP